MGCTTSKDTEGHNALEIDIGSLQILLSPDVGIQFKSKLINSLTSNLDQYTAHSQALIKTLAEQIATQPSK